ncbi:MAG: glycerophosphodiester phosphodiesterase family protein [Planctomycetia bacterium]|nr:glycerophosphodiester phosphodiesterase family protein [Planctomycetia bacterium]
MTRTTQFLFFFAAFFSTCLSGAEPTPATPVSAPCVAHRGFSHAAPENTLAANRAAMEVGAHGCEMDVYASADKILVLNHDGNLKRYTGLEKHISSLTLDEIKKLDVGSFKSPEFKGETVPTLEEAVEALKKGNCVAVVELKQDGLEQRTLDILNKHQYKDRSVIIAFSAKACKAMRALDSEIFIAWLCSKQKEEAEEAYIARIIATLDDCGINAVDLHHSGVTRNLVETLHAHGISVFCWTVNNPNDMQRVLDCGVDSVTTDRPDVLIPILKERGIQ